MPNVISPASIERMLPWKLTGQVSRMVGLSASVSGFPAPLGALCRLEVDSRLSIKGEVVGFHDDQTIVQPYGEIQGVRRGTRVVLESSYPMVRVGKNLLGRVIDGWGRFIDGGPTVYREDRQPLTGSELSPLNRPRIDRTLSTGVRVIDALLSTGMGQRMGIFAGSGVGKSTLMGMMARQSEADINVVVLVGERGREVREFLERDLGPEGLKRSVVVVATSEQPALLRLRSAHLGSALAEYYRDQGKNVLLMMDSVTRYALAQREIGLSAGEPPATRGYPPSVFAMLPRLLERSGRNERGSITAFYTVLVEGDDANEPISDTVRGILDGHVMLSRKLAHRGHWPAIDVLASVSRSMKDIVTPEHRAASEKLKQLLAAHREAEDMIAIGAYQSGSNPLVDQAVTMQDAIRGFLTQSIEETSNSKLAIDKLFELDRFRAALPSRRTP